MHSVNDSKILNISPLFLSSPHFASSSAPAPSIVIVPLTSMYICHYACSTNKYACIIKPHKCDLIIEVLNLI